MGFKVIPGATLEAQKELSGFIMAYPSMQIGIDDDTILYYTPDATDAEMFSAMEYNEFCGTFDPLKYFNIA